MCDRLFDDVPFFRQLFPSFSPRSTGFDSWPFRVGFTVGKVQLVQTFVWLLRFYPVIIIPSFIHLFSTLYFKLSYWWRRYIKEFCLCIAPTLLQILQLFIAILNSMICYQSWGAI